MLRVSLDDLTICPEIGSPFTWGPSSPGALKVERRKLLFFFALFQNIKHWRKGRASPGSRLLISKTLSFFFKLSFSTFFFCSFLTVTLNAPLFSIAVLPPFAPTSLEPPGTRRSLPPFRCRCRLGVAALFLSSHPVERAWVFSLSPVSHTWALYFTQKSQKPHAALLRVAVKRNAALLFSTFVC